MVQGIQNLKSVNNFMKKSISWYYQSNILICMKYYNDKKRKHWRWATASDLRVTEFLFLIMKMVKIFQKMLYSMAPKACWLILKPIFDFVDKISLLILLKKW